MKKWHLKAYIRLTPAGWMYLLVTLGLGMASVSSGNNLLYLITAMLLSSLILSGILSKVSLAGLRGQCKFPLFAFAQENTKVELKLENKKKLFTSYGISLFSPSVEGRELFFFALPPRTKNAKELQFLPPRRGKVSLAFYARTSFPFGLVEKGNFLMKTEGIVFPSLCVQHRALKNVFSRYFGENPSPEIGGSGDFYELRPYQSGEEARRIFWKFYAKWGKPFVKEGERETHPGWIIRLITEEGANLEALEEALSLCTTFIYVFYRRDRAIGLWANNRFFPPSTRQEDILQMLRFLALFDKNAYSAETAARIPFHVQIRVGREPRAFVDHDAA